MALVRELGLIPGKLIRKRSCAFTFTCIEELDTELVTALTVMFKFSFATALGNGILKVCVFSMLKSSS